jgi:hypothetical protein
MLILLNIPTFYAQINTGNTAAQSTVQTDIQGSGNVSTHIEVQANGEKKTLDANSPGTYSLSVKANNNGEQEMTPNLTPRPTGISRETTATPTAIIQNEQKSEAIMPSLFSRFAIYIENLFKKLFRAPRQSIQ